MGTSGISCPRTVLAGTCTRCGRATEPGNVQNICRSCGEGGSRPGTAIVAGPSTVRSMYLLILHRRHRNRSNRQKARVSRRTLLTTTTGRKMIMVHSRPSPAPSVAAPSESHPTTKPPISFVRLVKPDMPPSSVRIPRLAPYTEQIHTPW